VRGGLGEVPPRKIALVRTVRNLAIIALLAVPVAFVPGGGRAAETIVAALVMVFLVTLGVAGRQVYRENRLTFDTLTQRQRGILYAALGVVALRIAGTDELLASGAGTLLWIVLIAAAAFAIVRVWTESHSY
jgi:hypothetical protein